MLPENPEGFSAVSKKSDPVGPDFFVDGGCGLRDPRVRRSRNGRVFYMECGELTGGGVRAPRPTEQGWKLCVLRQYRAYRQNGRDRAPPLRMDERRYGGRTEPSAPTKAQQDLRHKSGRIDLIFGGSKFPGGQVAEFDLDAFIGGGFGGFLQEFFSIFV